MGSARRALSWAEGWAALLARFLSWQLATQIAGFAAGIAAVRLLAVGHFAQYSVTMAVQGMALVLADLGVTSGLSALAGRKSHDLVELRSAMASGLRFRRKLELPAMAASLLMLWFLERRAGASALDIAVYSVALIAAVHAQVLSGVYSVAPLILLRAEKLQAVLCGGAVVRAVLTVGVLAIWPDPRLGAIAAAVSLWLQSSWVRSLARRELGGVEENPRPEDDAQLGAVLRSQLITSVYFAFEPQITLALLAWFGGATQLAETGALGRIGAVFAAMGSVVGSLLTPRFARVKEPARLLPRYLQVAGVAAVMGGAVWGMSALFPEQVLWILGPRYAHLQGELILQVGAAATGLLISALTMLNISRAWVRGSWIYVPGTLLLQLGLLQVLDLSTVRGAILFGWGSQLSAFGASLFLTARGLRGELRAATTPPESSASVSSLAG